MTPKAPSYLYKPVGEFKERIMITNVPDVMEYNKKRFHRVYSTLFFPLLAVVAFLFGYTVIFGLTY